MSAPVTMTLADADALLATIGHRADMTVHELQEAILSTSPTDDQLSAFATALDIKAAAYDAEAAALGDYIALRNAIHG